MSPVVRRTTSMPGDIAGTKSLSSTAGPTKSMQVSVPQLSRRVSGQLTTASHRWNKEAGTLHNDAWPLHLKFHAFDPVMAVTDDRDNVWCVAP